MAVANLLWESAHRPLYTIWETGTRSELVFAAVHSTGSDILIALSALMLALFLIGNPAWPAVGRVPVVMATLTLGLT